MDTGNNTAGKTAPERYVSEKAFEELPDTFQKLAELLGEDQFELVAVNDDLRIRKQLQRVLFRKRWRKSPMTIYTEWILM